MKGSKNSSSLNSPDDAPQPFSPAGKLEDVPFVLYEVAEICNQAKLPQATALVESVLTLLMDNGDLEAVRQTIRTAHAVR